MDYNPLSPAVQNNPYPYYAELRDKAPVAWIEPMQAWAVSRYADVDFIFRNPRLPQVIWSSSRRHRGSCLWIPQTIPACAS
jgi:cytochrome P450